MAELVTTYQVLKSIHVLAAVVWVGGACMLQALAMLAVRSPNPADLVTFAQRQLRRRADLRPRLADPGRVRRVGRARGRVRLR